MDPDDCLRQIEERYLHEIRNDHEFRDYDWRPLAEDLHEWIRKGGFKPYWSRWILGTHAFSRHCGYEFEIHLLGKIDYPELP